MSTCNGNNTSSGAADRWSEMLLQYAEENNNDIDVNICRPGSVLQALSSHASGTNSYAEDSPYVYGDPVPYTPAGADAGALDAEVIAVSVNNGGSILASTTNDPYHSNWLEDIPSNLLPEAYRKHIPCAMPHQKDGSGGGNDCAASPLCMAGLQTMKCSQRAVEDCVVALMGTGPYIIPDGQGVANNHNNNSNADATEAMCREDDGGDEAARLSHRPSSCLWRGIINIGNTCYFNSILQLLFATPLVRRAVLSDGSSEVMGSHGSVIDVDAVATDAAPMWQSGLREVFAQMAFSRDGRGADASSFAKFLSINPSEQQDAQEFLTLLVDWLRCHAGQAVKSAIDKCLEGTFLYDRRCGACGRSTKRAEHFLYLSVPVKSTLAESFCDFLKPEEVEGFVCESCRQTATATSRQYLRTLPDVLVVHLNRFEFDLQTLQRKKVNMTVSFPLLLDMTPYEQQWVNERKGQAEGEEEVKGTGTTTSPTGNTAAMGSDGKTHMYELRGVVNHLGDSALSGHYTYHGKCARPAADGSAHPCWLNFNDTEVTVLNRYKGVSGASKEVYMLVYHRLPSTTGTTPAAAAASEQHASAHNEMDVKPAVVPSEEEAGGATAEVGDTETEHTTMMLSADAPNPGEFPEYLVNYAMRVNEAALERRMQWKMAREELATALSKWAEAAQAVFTPDSKAMESDDVYCLPTVWLRMFGRAFLAPYIHAESFGGGGATRSKNNNNDPFGVAPGKLLQDAPHLLTGGATYFASLRQHCVQHYQQTVMCPHGKIAPWGAYKMVSREGFTLIREFLLLCGMAGEDGLVVNNNSSGTCTASSSSSPYALQGNACGRCASSMAAQIQCVAATMRADNEALHQIALLSAAPAVAEGGDNDGSYTAGVVVSEEVLRTFEAFVQARNEWASPLLEMEGLTGAVSLWWHPSLAAAAGSGKMSASSPLPTLAAVKAILVDRLSNMGLPADNEEDDQVEWDMQRTMTCQHGAIRPDAEMQVLPESLWRYLVERIPVLLREYATSPSADSRGAAIQSQILPYIAAAGLRRCTDCVHGHRQKRAIMMNRIEEIKLLPTLAAAGRAVTNQLNGNTEGETGTEEHSNSTFFKRPAEKEYREHVKTWRAAQDTLIAKQESVVQKLQAAAKRQKESDARWSAMTQRGGRRNNNNSNRNGKAPATPESPESPVLTQLQDAEIELDRLRKEAPADHVVNHGLLPMWWVAQWYRCMTASAPDDVSSHEQPPPVNFSDLRCPHGGSLLESAWLNPKNGFWQGMRARRPDRIWNRDEHGSTTETDLRPALWMPPMLIVPMKEYETVCERYGIHNESNGFSNEEEASTPTPPPLALGMLLAECNGERQLRPASCAECCSSLLDAFEEDCGSFTNGSLRLQLHLRTSKKLYYDATQVMHSHQVDGGLHHYTTLQQLRAHICEYVMMQHGYVIPGDKLEILRSGRKQLKVRRTAAAAAVAPPSHVDASSTDLVVDPPRPSHSALESATLFELGIGDGDTLLVNLTETTAVPHITGVPPPVEVWEDIPAELLMSTTHGPHNGGPHEPSGMAFAESRLTTTAPKNGAPPASGVVVADPEGVSCGVCTFLNAFGMTHCEMCESPL